MKPYDYLALVPIVEGAGGIMTDWKVNNLSFMTQGALLWYMVITISPFARCHALLHVSKLARKVLSLYCHIASAKHQTNLRFW